ncbi:MAG TPA: glucose 1-dehydrogenase [Acidimicrobiales bacterium]|nr:glucose 1-dehydrogenase [Acidimicrobiales bacterium]
MGRLDGKVALITGGARGQGAAEAALFVAEGARVVIGDVLDAEGELTAKELGDGVAYLHHDVTSETEWEAIVAATTERFGAPDVLVNNAGIFKIIPMAMTSLDDYMQIVNINQVGVFLGMKAVAPAMVARSSGSIINISSVAGLTGTAGTIAYGASKFAVRGMTKVAAMELAPFGVRVNSVHPGIIDTPMFAEIAKWGDDVVENVRQRIPLGRLAGAEDVARLALFLASDDSAYSTGSEFVVDGGMTAN